MEEKCNLDHTKGSLDLELEEHNDVVLSGNLNYQILTRKITLVENLITIHSSRLEDSEQYFKSVRLLKMDGLLEILSQIEKE